MVRRWSCRSAVIPRTADPPPSRGRRVCDYVTVTVGGCRFSAEMAQLIASRCSGGDLLSDLAVSFSHRDGAFLKVRTGASR
jgi:hypothetical protein